MRSDSKANGHLLNALSPSGSSSHQLPLWILGSLVLVIQPSPTHAEPSASPATKSLPLSSIYNCREQFGDLLIKGERAARVQEFRYRNRLLYSLASPANPLRERIREWLQVLHNHPYPILAIDEAPRAHGWARFVFGTLNAEAQELLEVEKIGPELSSAVKRIKAFQSQIEALMDETQNLTMLQESLRRELATKHSRAGGVKIYYPTIFRNEKNQLVDSLSQLYFGSRPQVAIELKKTSLKLREIQSRAAERAYEQAILIKKLETYRHEVLRQAQSLQQPPLPPEHQATFNEILSIFQTTEAKALKPEYQPPEWIWQKLKWVQLHAELKSLFLRDAPKSRDESALTRVFKYIQSLSEEEKRSLGVQDMSSSLNWFKRTKWARVITTWVGFGAAAEITVGDTARSHLFSVWEFFWEDRIRKEQCASKPSPEEYTACAIEYLRDKFPTEILFSHERAQELFDEKNVITQPVMRAEFEDLTRRRNQFLYESKQKEHFSAAAKQGILLSDRSSSEYRQHLIQETDEDTFKTDLLSEAPEKGYLMFKYASAYRRPEVRSLAQTLSSATSLDQVETLLLAMKNLHPGNELLKELATDLGEIMKARIEYRQAQRAEKTTESALQKAASDAIE